MLKTLLFVVVFLACSSLPDRQWEGVPADRSCSDPYAAGHAVCIAEGKVYQCVRLGDRRMLCSRDTVEIKCTNIVNVETVCPGKP